MLAELLLTATCILAPGTLYNPPRGWTIEAVRAQGTENICHDNLCLGVEPRQYTHTTVVVSRTVSLGEEVKGPEGCTVIATLKEPKR